MEHVDYSDETTRTSSGKSREDLLEEVVVKLEEDARLMREEYGPAFRDKLSEALADAARMRPVFDAAIALVKDMRASGGTTFAGRLMQDLYRAVEEVRKDDETPSRSGD